jgi:hypothetical protein
MNRTGHSQRQGWSSPFHIFKYTVQVHTLIPSLILNDDEASDISSKVTGIYLGAYRCQLPYQTYLPTKEKEDSKLFLFLPHWQPTEITSESKT